MKASDFLLKDCQDNPNQAAASGVCDLMCLHTLGSSGLPAARPKAQGGGVPAPAGLQVAFMTQAVTLAPTSNASAEGWQKPSLSREGHSPAGHRASPAL